MAWSYSLSSTCWQAVSCHDRVATYSLFLQQVLSISLFLSLSLPGGRVVRWNTLCHSLPIFLATSWSSVCGCAVLNLGDAIHWSGLTGDKGMLTRIVPKYLHIHIIRVTITPVGSKCHNLKCHSFAVTVSVQAFILCFSFTLLIFMSWDQPLPGFHLQSTSHAEQSRILFSHLCPQKDFYSYLSWFNVWSHSQAGMLVYQAGMLVYLIVSCLRFHVRSLHEVLDSVLDIRDVQPIILPARVHYREHSRSGPISQISTISQSLCASVG